MNESDIGSDSEQTSVHSIGDVFWNDTEDVGNSTIADNGGNSSVSDEGRSESFSFDSAHNLMGVAHSGVTSGSAVDSVDEEFIRVQQELIDTRHKLNVCEGHSSSLTNEMDMLRRELLGVRGQYELLLQRHKDSQLNQSGVNEEVAKIRLEKDRLAASLMESQASLHAQLNQTQSLSSQLSTIRNEKNELELVKQTALTELIELRYNAKQNEKKQELMATRVKNAETELAHVREKSTLLAKENNERVESLQQRYSDTLHELSLLKTQYSSEKNRYQDKFQALLDDIDICKEDIIHKDLQIDRLQGQLAADGVLASNQRRLKDELEAQLASADFEKSQLTNQQSEKRRTVSELESQCSVFQAKETELLGLLDLDKEQMSMLKKEIVSSTSTIQSKDAQIVELQQKIQHMEHARTLEVSGDDLQAGMTQLAREIASRQEQDDHSNRKHHYVELGNGVFVSIVDIYDKYCKLLQELQNTDRQKRSIELQLHQMQEEVLQKSPILQEQQEQARRLAQVHAVTITELRQTQQKLRSADNMNEELSAKNIASEQLIAALRAESGDLARQIRQQLKKSIVQTGGLPDHMVLFNNVDELQAQNQQLLVLSHRLKGANEILQTEKTDLESKLHDQVVLLEQIEKCKLVITTLKEQREALELRTETLMKVAEEKQHDRLETTLIPTSVSSPHKEHVSSDSMTIHYKQQILKIEKDSRILESRAEQMVGQIKQLENELGSERAQHQTERRNLFHELDVLKKQMEAERTQHNEVRVRLSRTEAEAKRGIDSLQQFRARVDELSGENVDLQHANTLLHNRTQQSQELIEYERKARIAAEENLTALKIEAETLKLQLQLMREAEDRLREDVVRMSVQLTKQESLLSRLESSRDNLNLSEVQAHRNQHAMTEMLKEELARARKQEEKLTVVVEERTRALDTSKTVLQARELEQNGEIQTLILDKQRLQAVVDSTLHDKTKLETSITELKERINVLVGSSISGSTVPSTTNNTDMIHNNTRIEFLVSENKKLTQQYNDALVQYNTMSDLAKGHEKALRLVSVELEELRKSKLEEFDLSQKRIDELVLRVEELNKETQRGELEKEEQYDKIISHESDLKQKEQEFSRVKDMELEHAKRLQNEMDRLSEQARIHADQAAQAQAKYKNEMLQHADDLRQMGIYETQIQQLQSEIANLKRSVGNSANISEQETQLKNADMKLTQKVEELEALKLRCSSLERQVGSYLDKLGASDGSSSVHDEENHESGMHVKLLREEKLLLLSEIDSLRSKNVQQSEKLLQAQEAGVGKATVVPRSTKSSSRIDALKEDSEQYDTYIKTLQESNENLRSKTEKLQARVRQLEELLLNAQVDQAPLLEQLEKEQATNAALRGEVDVLREETKRWAQRNQSLLQKYNQVDPEVHKQQGIDRQNCMQQNEEYAKTVAVLQKECESATMQLKSKDEKIKKMNEQLLGISASKKEQTDAQIALKEQLATLTSELESTKNRKQQVPASLLTELRSLREERTQLNDTRDALRSSLKDAQSTLEQLDVVIVEKDNELNNLRFNISSLETKVNVLHTTVSNQESTQKHLLSEHQVKQTEMSKQMQNLTCQMQAKIDEIDQQSSENSKLKQDVENCQVYIESLREEYVSAANNNNNNMASNEELHPAAHQKRKRHDEDDVEEEDRHVAKKAEYAVEDEQPDHHDEYYQNEDVQKNVESSEANVVDMNNNNAYEDDEEPVEDAMEDHVSDDNEINDDDNHTTGNDDTHNTTTDELFPHDDDDSTLNQDHAHNTNEDDHDEVNLDDRYTQAEDEDSFEGDQNFAFEGEEDEDHILAGWDPSDMDMELQEE